jgi:hypothetical protein
MRFRPDSFDRFLITDYVADAHSRTAILRYALDDVHRFEEQFHFQSDEALPPFPLEVGAEAGFERVVRLLHLAAGVSYYKTAAPVRLVAETGTLTNAESRLCHDLYDLGLREFAYRNGLSVPRELEVTAWESRSHPGDTGSGHHETEAPRPGVAVPIGGGKDSIVVLEALRDLNPVLVSVNPNPASLRVASISRRPLVRIERKLDPLLFELNQNGALNGHVPVTAIVSLASVAAGYLFGYDTTAMALESSADEPSRVVGMGTDLGVRRASGESAAGAGAQIAHDVNHQWSKSARFETQLQEVLRESVHPAIRYLSPLRKFNELEITGAFATLTPYLKAFRSCNNVARLSGASDSWCQDCAKCRFVFLALATAVDRGRLVALFGSDLLDQESQVGGYLEMLDPATKPFDCVGTVAEVEASLRRVVATKEWKGAAVVERLRSRLEAGRSDLGEVAPASPAAVMAGARRSLAPQTLE